MATRLPRDVVRCTACAGLILVLVFVGACNSGSGDGNTTTGDPGSTTGGSTTNNNPGSTTDTTPNTSGGDSSSTGSTGSTGGSSNGTTANSAANTNVAVACATSGDDSIQNADGSASIVRSYTVGSPVYHSVVTRKDYLNRDIWLDYMVHEPTGTPKGIVVLIAGGAMNAAIYGTEGNTATHSGKNYLVRSAHRYAQAGYRVITMDRPSDFSKYGNIDSAGYLYDAYRTSPDHAIDITTIVNRENSEDLPVFIAGTSRGAISAVSQNSLAAGIDISSPVTVGGLAVGTSALPVTEVQVPVHLLYHQDDGCSVSSPANSASLFDQFITAGIEVTANNVSGGFADTVANNPCGALDFHGYTGIENCAVNTSTTWMDDQLATMESQHPGNARPVAQDMTVSDMMGQAIDITLLATDSDDTTLTYSLRYYASSLGGTLSLLNGNTVHYEAPNNDLPAMTTDKFVFTVVDSKGSRSSAVVSVELSQAAVDHTAAGLAPCSTCHTLPQNFPHISTTLECDLCHTVTSWPGQKFDHSNITAGCSTCHDGITASGPPPSHATIQDECDVCHGSTTDWLVITNPL